MAEPDLVRLTLLLENADCRFTLTEWQKALLKAMYSPVKPLSLVGFLVARGPRPLPIDGHEYARRRRARARRRG